MISHGTKMARGVIFLVCIFLESQQSKYLLRLLTKLTLFVSLGYKKDEFHFSSQVR